MTEQEQKLIAFSQILNLIQQDARQVMTDIEMAAADLAEGRRNGAIGALIPVDENLERMTNMLAALRGLHRAMPF